MRAAICRFDFTPRTTRLSGHLSLVALLAGLGAGCAGISPMNAPIFTGSTANQQAILSAEGGSAPGYQTAGVQGSPLPPPPGVAQSAYSGHQPQAPSIPPQLRAPEGLPARVGQVGAGGGSASSGGSYSVQPGDTMYSIARRYDVSVDDLVSANGGSSVARLGQRVVIPGGGTPQREPRVHLARVTPQAELPPAPKVAAPPPTPIAPPPAAETLAPSPAPAAPAKEQAAIGPQPSSAAVQPPAALQPDTAQPAQEATGPAGFRWPVRGRVISEFGKKPNGERNDGINLAVPEGTPVKAAEGGTVIYSGNELKSFGNLVLVRHAGGWVSAYAHNSDLKVKRGEQVQRGQTIALSGMSGGVTTPQLGFQLRKNASPVDPLLHMTES